MDILITFFLPLSLVVIMLSLGLGLNLGDFKRVVQQPKAFAIGAASQLVILPVTAYAIARLFALSPEMGFGLMILSLCPGGVTSNILTKLARGDLALSISLTGVISLVAVFTMPPLVAFFADQFLGMDAPPVNVTSLGVKMFLLTAVPVVAGLAVRHFAPKIANAAEPIFDKLSVLLFVVVVVGALAANWRLFVDNMPVLGPAMIALIVCLLAVGVLLGKLFSLNYGQATAIAIETGVQNATLGITVGALIVEQAGALPPFSMPSGFYGIVMYLVTIPFVWWRRSKIAA